MRGLAGLFWLALATCAAAQVSSPQGPTTPSYASAGMGTMYVSTCNVTVATNTPTSTFCPTSSQSYASGVDSNSVAARTYPPNTLVPGKAFAIDGDGTYSAPTANTNTAGINILIGSNSIPTTTPAAPAATGQGLIFHADCRVVTTTSIQCTGWFFFVLLNTAPVPVDVFGTTTFNPAIANTIDVQGFWNGTITSQSTTVQSAILAARN